MPLDTGQLLNRDNAIPALLQAFQSNNTVKALVFLPGVSDDFYLINRGLPKLNLRAENLLDAIVALTNATPMRVAFRPPFLLLHVSRDKLEPSLTIKHKATAERLNQQSSLGRELWVDTHWREVQPQLQTLLHMKVLPPAASRDAWHFARHNLAACNLADWDLLAALSLTGKTTVTVRKSQVVFALREGKP